MAVNIVINNLTIPRAMIARNFPARNACCIGIYIFIIQNSIDVFVSFTSFEKEKKKNIYLFGIIETKKKYLWDPYTVKSQV